MPIKPIMPIAYYAYCLISLLCLLPNKPNMPIMPIMPPQKHQWGRHPLAPGQREHNPLLPRCGTHRPHLCSSFELKPDERLYSSLQLSLPQPLAADSNSTSSWASAFEVLAVIEPSRMCCSMQSYITVPSGRIYVFFIVFLNIIMCYFTTTFWPFTMYTPFVRCFKSPLTRTPCRL